ncbi:phosphoribosylanthranilate isomerase [Alteribacillus iranensis]|uniref:N-(5'-phosphoribosyl)anthranilate isomerase n=1 Tax=Alteribacillus iranensis TaxID=930128 RepID=A0A1I1ZR21_9BACI|nr:phosphoribosylanthranilate isomerase [Alteribacillus iranensis]SFE34076.1 phosphoribosylanthranilate isomerase [Alteribacillus iranensis]
MNRPRFKLCGLQSEQDVITASSSQADYVGFVFAESKRQVKPEDAASWLERHELPGKKVAALFVNASPQEIKQTSSVLRPDIIQLHGAESPEQVQQIKDAMAEDVWKALPHNDYTLEKMKDYASIVDGFVIDAKVKGAWGGTGQQFDWSHVPDYVTFGKESGIPVLIAGGINPTNIKKLLVYEPWGVDLSSGAEKDGRKDKQRLRDLEEELMKNV